MHDRLGKAVTIWLDVTTTLGWARPAVGIVRVEVATAKYFLGVNDPAIRFCRFDKGVGYSEVGREALRAALARPSGTPAEARPAKSREQRLERRILELVARLPARYRDSTTRFVVARREAFRGFFRAYREARRATAVAWRGSRDPQAVVSENSPANRRSEPPFVVGDVYVSLGLDWVEKDLRYLGELKRRLRLKILLFCYDIIPIRLPHLCWSPNPLEFSFPEVFRRYVTDVARCADRILCISEWSRRDLHAFLNRLGPRLPELGTVRLGSELEPAVSLPTSNAVAQVLAHRFILFVSTIERRKNHETLYRAYTRLVDSGQRELPLLVFVGMPGWRVEDLMIDFRLDPRIQPYLQILNHVSDNDLQRLYQNCYFTVFPSLYEGWGIPVAESLAYGKFCLASNAASIPEVGGDLIEYLDPWDVPAWAERLSWYFDHPEEIQAREATIRSRHRPTPWKETGAAILAAALALGADKEVEWTST
jgi:glycosyltransferase involved in cell wall biosynthesis